MEGVGKLPYTTEFIRYINISDKLQSSTEIPPDFDTWVTFDNGFNKDAYARKYQPIAQMTHPQMGQVNEDIRISTEAAIRQFYNGTMSEEDFTAKFKELTEKNFQANHEYINHGLTSPDMDKTMMKVFYGEYRRMILDVAVQQNNEEGRQYVQGDPARSQWKYYNSDYYNKSESAITAITKGIEDIAQEHGHESFEIPDYEEKQLWLYNDFNTALNNPMVASDYTFLNHDTVPTEGIVWFYQQGFSESVTLDENNPFTKFDPNNFLTATSWATLRGPDGKVQKTGLDIIYDYSSKDRYNVGSLLQFSGSSSKVSAANAFMNQLQVYRMDYFADRHSNYSGYSSYA